MFCAWLRDNPHAWVKLWKHHAAEEEANRLTDRARELGYDFIDRYGGKINSEWIFPKIWQILNEAPEIYDAADRFIEAARLGGVDAGGRGETQQLRCRLQGNLVKKPGLPA